jgi:hypothetical protein
MFCDFVLCLCVFSCGKLRKNVQFKAGEAVNLKLFVLADSDFALKKRIRRAKVGGTHSADVSEFGIGNFSDI